MRAATSIVKPDWFDLTHCIKCRYNLTGLPREGVCPECGQAYSSETWVLRPAPSTWPFAGNLAGLAVFSGILIILVASRNPLWPSLAIACVLSLAAYAWNHMRRVDASDPADAAARHLPTMIFDSRGIIAAVGHSRPMPWNLYQRLHIRHPLGGLRGRAAERRTWHARLIPPFFSFKVTRVLEFTFFANQDEMRALSTYMEDCLRASTLPDSAASIAEHP